MSPDNEAVEREVQRRVRERQELISTTVDLAVEKLRPELNAIREEISDSNHIKAEYGNQLNELMVEVKKHIGLPWHPGTQAFIEQAQADQKLYGLDSLSAEEKAAVPTVLRTVIALQQDAKEEHKEREARSASTARFWQTVAALAALLAALIALLSAAGVFQAIRTNVFHLHS
jgi:hypothetical protein